MGVPPPPALPLRGRELAPISALALFRLGVADLGGAGLAHTFLLERLVGLRALDRGSGLFSRHAKSPFLDSDLGAKRHPTGERSRQVQTPKRTRFPASGRRLPVGAYLI